jgi:metal-dependent amidase/aminoacylase/carboxypeptidase family protein
LKEGWLDDVDEIYGFHNLPLDDLPGHLYVKPGPVMANSIIINLKVFIIINMKGYRKGRSWICA